MYGLGSILGAGLFLIPLSLVLPAVAMYFISKLAFRHVLKETGLWQES